MSASAVKHCQESGLEEMWKCKTNEERSGSRNLCFIGTSIVILDSIVFPLYQGQDFCLWFRISESGLTLFRFQHGQDQ